MPDPEFEGIMKAQNVNVHFPFGTKVVRGEGYRPIMQQAALPTRKWINDIPPPPLICK